MILHLTILYCTTSWYIILYHNVSFDIMYVYIHIRTHIYIYIHIHIYIGGIVCIRRLPGKSPKAVAKVPGKMAGQSAGQIGEIDRDLRQKLGTDCDRSELRDGKSGKTLGQSWGQSGWLP